MIERALKGARLPPASGARARGEMDAGGLACAAIGTCLRTFFGKCLEISWPETAFRIFLTGEMEPAISA